MLSKPLASQGGGETMGQCQHYSASHTRCRVDPHLGPHRLFYSLSGSLRADLSAYASLSLLFPGLKDPGERLSACGEARSMRVRWHDADPGGVGGWALRAQPASSDRQPAVVTIASLPGLEGGRRRR